MLAGSAFAAVGGAITLWPFIDQMNPDQSALALASTEVDLTPVKAGQAITIMWRGKPVFVRNRTPEEVKAAKDVDVKTLPDAKEPDGKPATDANRTKEKHENWMVLVGICTHLGCSPTFRPDVAPADLGPAWKGGFFCPCHGSRFDLAGRVYKGVPAPSNLEVPSYRFLSDSRVLIGVDPEAA